MRKRWWLQSLILIIKYRFIRHAVLSASRIGYRLCLKKHIKTSSQTLSKEDAEQEAPKLLAHLAQERFFPVQEAVTGIADFNEPDVPVPILMLKWMRSSEPRKTRGASFRMCQVRNKR